MFERTRKRARLEPETSSDFEQWMKMAADQNSRAAVGWGDGVVEPKEDEEFWYDDGSIVLIAGDTKFRVFKGILADHSPVFRDMLSLPQPQADPSSSQAAPTCPVVHVTDSPDELRYLLRVCIPKSGANRYHSPDPTYDEVSALIRLGHKYQIPELVRSSINYLKIFHTDDFDAWAKVSRRKRPPKFSESHAIGVVNLARLTGCAELLPPALLACCLLRDDSVVAGVPSSGAAPRETLSLDDMRLCYLARGKLSAAGVAAALRVCRPQVADTCTEPLHCQWTLACLVRNLPEKADRLCNGNPFRSYADLYSCVRDSVYRACYAMLEERDKGERWALWKKLPDFWGIAADGWAADDEAGVAAS